MTTITSQLADRILNSAVSCISIQSLGFGVGTPTHPGNELTM